MNAENLRLAIKGVTGKSERMYCKEWERLQGSDAFRTQRRLDLSRDKDNRLV